MAQTIIANPNGDTPAIVADKVCALPANQGLNESTISSVIKTEIQAAITAGTLLNVYNYYSSGNIVGLI